MKTEKDQTETDRFINKLAMIITVALMALVVVYGLYCLNFFSDFKFSKDTDTWGTFGDYVGGILNPILSFLTLIALILTLHLQRTQLDISKEELKLSREELKASREALEKSAEAQALTANALNEQTKYAVMSARLSALNASIAVVTELLTQKTKGGYHANPNEINSLHSKKESIANEILKILDQI